MNNSRYRYILEPYRSLASKHACPQCHRKRCFTFYIDTDTGLRVNEECGRCDHEHSCGYHLKPSDYFRQHPDDRFARQPRDWRQQSRPAIIVEDRQPQTVFIDDSLVERSHSPISMLMQWLSKITPDAERLKCVYDEYRLGATRQGDVIFWYIDREGRVHDGKIMAYGSDGHRANWANWVGSLMRKQKQLPEDFVSEKTLFGEHLLSWKPESVVGLVESEKTAIICALWFPEILWLATGGSSMLNDRVAEVLRNRKVKIFPDSGCLDKWREKMQKVRGVDYSFCDQLEQYLPNTDIADVLLGEAKRPDDEATQAFKRMKADNTAFREFAERLGLVAVSIGK